MVRGVPEMDDDGVDDDDHVVDNDEYDDDDDGDDARRAWKLLLRSKGFAWTADSNVKSLYWSHAGRSFEMQCLGRWWATLPRAQWPDEAREDILTDFDSIDHDEDNDDSSSSVGDRRQEIVFIGPGMSTTASRDGVREALDACLLNDEEWDAYRANRRDEGALWEVFPNPLPTRMLTY